ncbi:hypothetical protein BY458DRAFT_534310 [Sporodiniella umbellata]|nr:hypothetical protein BY458DRAFT_534310 [Sporodiniella umbellata]
MSTQKQDSLIYQTPQYNDDFDEYENSSDTMPQILNLSLRGVRTRLDKETLVSLPESLLIAMFPNGIILGKPYENEQEEEQEGITAYVDFDPQCLDYVLSFYQTTIKERKIDPQTSLFVHSQAAQYYPYILERTPVIVLREELEYFCICNHKETNPLISKRAAGNYLKADNQVFAALEKNVGKANNVAEQHLIDMLCQAGFSRDNSWAYRELEPTKAFINSMSLVALKSPGPDHTAQKLLLFWKKPARKCWWDKSKIQLHGQEILLWARRTWTLELIMI